MRVLRPDDAVAHFGARAQGDSMRGSADHDKTGRQ